MSRIRTLTSSCLGSARAPLSHAWCVALGCVVSLAATGDLRAQVPSTDVFVVSVSHSETPTFGDPTNITDREGYDNQPAFATDGESVFYTSIRDEQADIFRYDLKAGTHTSITATAETSEYSPTPVGGGGAITVVRVEEDGTTQRLWRFATGDSDQPSLLLPGVAPVGYHAWVDKARVLMFVLGDPPTLEIARVGEDGSRRLAANVGRSLARIPQQARMSFIEKRGEGDWWAVAIDPDTGTQEDLVKMQAGNEDVAWSPDGSLWTGDGGSLFRWQPGQEGWQRFADLRPHGITQISRLAWRPDGRMLALVSERAVDEDVAAAAPTDDLDAKPEPTADAEPDP